MAKKKKLPTKQGMLGKLERGEPQADAPALPDIPPPPVTTTEKRIDIFVTLDQLFRGERPREYPSPWIMHRFLASDPDFAQVADEIQILIRGPENTFECWRSIVLPIGLQRAPRLTYVGPKREPAAEGVIAAIMKRKGMSRSAAEDAFAILSTQHDIKAIARELGVYVGD